MQLSCQKNKDENQSAKHDETTQEKGQNNLMSSFAEKALSVAGPVVPTKGDGEVDHEKYVNVTIVFFLSHYSFSFVLGQHTYHVLTFCKQACCSFS